MFKSVFIALSLGAVALCAQAADVGVSVQISQPGVYGRIDIGRFPQPQLVVLQPVLVRPAPQRAAPAYLWVPPGHRKNWRKHCHRYQACGTPVYFVQEGWYREHVMAGQPGPQVRAPGPGSHEEPGRGRGKGKDKKKSKDKGHGKGHDDDQGKGHGRGKGH